jgi:hypothetical protein
MLHTDLLQLFRCAIGPIDVAKCTPVPKHHTNQAYRGRGCKLPRICKHRHCTEVSGQLPTLGDLDSSSGCQ